MFPLRGGGGGDIDDNMFQLISCSSIGNKLTPPIRKGKKLYLYIYFISLHVYFRSGNSFFIRLLLISESVI